jgi:DNA-binding CsgD family transcriptional regulator
MQTIEAHLSPRERIVLRYLADGRSVQQIADHLQVGPASIKTHVRRAAFKLGANSMLHAVARALENGLI